jgi:hypothetical protein
MKKKQQIGKYDDRTSQLMDLRAEAEQQFDKQIIYLSGGALVFSMGFVKDIIGANNVPICKYLLIISWICFASSLIVNLFSYLSSRQAIDKELIGENKKSNLYNILTKILNWTSIGGLLIGLVLLIIFATLNFKK